MIAIMSRLMRDRMARICFMRFSLFLCVSFQKFFNNFDNCFIALRDKKQMKQKKFIQIR
jgi:hypothetical protein